MKTDTFLIGVGLHAMMSSAVFFGMMSSGLRAPDAPAFPWQDAVLLVLFWASFFPSILLQYLGINLWVLSLLVVPINSLIWMAVIVVAIRFARFMFRPNKASSRGVGS